MRLKCNTRRAVVAACAILLIACQQREPDSHTDSNSILARVNGKAVTEQAVELALEATLGPSARTHVDAGVRKALLDGLILTELLAAKQEAMLTESERQSLDLAVNAYRNQQLARHYLREAVMLQDITDAQVEEYYHDNIQQFSQADIKQYAMLKVPEYSKNNKPTLTLLNEAKTATSLKEYAQLNAVKEAGVIFLSGTLRKGLFTPRLEQHIDGLEEGETSSVFFVEGIPYVARITGVEKQQAKPLSDVDKNVRELLVSQQYKQAVEQLKMQVLAEAEIEYQ